MGVRRSSTCASRRSASGRRCSRATPSSGSARTRRPSRAGSRVGMPRERIIGAARARRTSGRRPRPGRAGRTASSTSTAARSSAAAAPSARRAASASASSSSGTSSSWSSTSARTGTLTPLPKQNVDTGLGLERAAMLLQGVDSIFEVDNVRALITWVEERSGKRYGESELVTKACRVIADHARAATFLLADGVLPSNEGRGYVLRRVIRRAVHFGRRIGLESPFMSEVSALVRERDAGVVPRARASTGARSRSTCARRRSASRRRSRAASGCSRSSADSGDVSRRRRVPAPRHVRLPARADAGARGRARPRRRRGDVHPADGRAARALARPQSSVARRGARQRPAGPSSSATRRPRC